MRHAIRLLIILLASQFAWAGDFALEEALLNAVIGNNEETIGILLNEGANPSKTFGWGTSSLLYAAMDGKLKPEIFRRLVEKSTNINEKNSVDITPLYHAVNAGYASFVEILIEKNALVDEKTWKAAAGNQEMLKVLNFLK